MNAKTDHGRVTHSSSIPPSQKRKPRLKLSTEQSCLIKRSQWILPLSDHLQETSQRGAEVEEGVHEGHEAGAEARVAAEVAREGVLRVLMETLSEQRGSGVRVQFHTTRSSPANLIRIEDSKGSPVLHICLIRSVAMTWECRLCRARQGMSAY
jgi:hypothetical protein